LILAIDSAELDAFTTELAQKLVNIESGCMLHPGIKHAFSTNKNELLKQDGVQQITEALDVEMNYADQTIITVQGTHFLSNPRLHQEVFGPFSLIVKCTNKEELLEIIEGLEGQLTGTIIAEENELDEVQDILDELQHRVGRVIFNGVPTGVEVCPSMHHGGPYPATTDARFTAVGIDAIKRWLRPVAFQNFPLELLPVELK
jgi:NADP-dependent aldehyde dehydrogenase